VTTFTIFLFSIIQTTDTRSLSTQIKISISMNI